MNLRPLLIVCIALSPVIGQTVDLEGVVLNRHTKKPVPGVALYLAQKSGPYDTTDAQGRFTMSNGVSVRPGITPTLTNGPGLSIRRGEVFFMNDAPGRVTASIFSLSGRKISSFNRSMPAGPVVISSGSLPQGLYLCRVQTAKSGGDALFMALPDGGFSAMSRGVSRAPHGYGPAKSAAPHVDTIMAEKAGCLRAIHELSSYSGNGITILIDTLSDALIRGEMIEQKIAFHVLYDGSENDLGYVSKQRLYDQVAQLNKAFHAQEDAPNRTVQKRLALPVEFTLTDMDIAHIDAYDPERLREVGLDPSKLSHGYATRHAVFFNMLSLENIRPVVAKALVRNPTEYLNVYIGNVSANLGLCRWFPWEMAEDSWQNTVLVDYRMVTGVPGSDIWANSRKQGDILTHEIGHYYGLYHTYEGSCTFGDGDLVDDTPRMKGKLSIHVDYTKKKELDKIRCPGQGAPPVHNYMSAADDRIRYEYTPGQVERMMMVLYKYKPVLMKSAKWKDFEEWKKSVK